MLHRLLSPTTFSLRINPVSMAEPWEENYGEGIPEFRRGSLDEAPTSSFQTMLKMLEEQRGKPEEQRGRPLNRIAMKCYAEAGSCDHDHMEDDESFCRRNGSTSPARYTCVSQLSPHSAGTSPVSLFSIH